MALILTIGAPGSGKSSWADKLPPNVLRLERDRFREAIFGSRQAYQEHEFEHCVKSRAVTSAMMAAMQNWPVPEAVLSDCNIHYRAAQPFLDLAHQARVPVELKVFATHEDTLLERNLVRPEHHRVPEDVLKSFIRDFYDSMAWFRHVNYPVEIIRGE